jgi:tetratricopeptide (TPR) repeat protein
MDPGSVVFEACQCRWKLTWRLSVWPGIRKGRAAVRASRTSAASGQDSSIRPNRSIMLAVTRLRLVLLELALAAGSAAWPQTEPGSELCASCHSAIYASYRSTPMASSARKLDPASAPETFERASFDHAASGFQYGVSVTNSGYVLRFEKANGVLDGQKTLAYAIGSGVRARSYLLAQDGFLYEAPVAYYSAGKSWGLAPGFDQFEYPYLTRPIAPGCLSCHASLIEAVPFTLNRYGTPPFLDGGVACERCHGSGEAHVAKMRSGKVATDPEIVNPAKLAPDRRDAICAQCHLTGEVTVMRVGSNWSSFRPGNRLSDTQTVFVRTGQRPGIKVTSHVEDLALSACKRASGDKLWCGSCHDPHSLPAPSQTGVWFRAKCLSCHATRDCSETLAARTKLKDDCIGCHMPKSPATDAEHVVFTDHSIPRRPRRALLPPAPDAELVAFGGAPASPRDLALAYAIKAIGRQTGADRTRALSLLEKAASTAPNDVEVLLFLAERYRNDGKNDLALPLYQRAIQLDAGQVTGSVGLGGIMMEQGNYAEAIRLWTDALSKNSGLELVRMNLAVALLRTGERAAARSMLEKAVSLNPAFPPTRQMLEQISHAP